MPRYYLHISNGDEFPDRTGSDLPDLDAARRQALEIAETMLLDETPKHHPWRVTIADEDGLPLDTVTNEDRRHRQ